MFTVQWYLLLMIFGAGVIIGVLLVNIIKDIRRKG